jgi:hypothetical protein
MARAKKDIEKEIIEVVKKLPVEKKAQVLDFAKRMIKPPRAEKKLGKGAAFMGRLFSEGLYDGDGLSYDPDQMIYEDMRGERFSTIHGRIQRQPIGAINITRVPCDWRRGSKKRGCIK